jgi:hypothetical protein
VLALHPSSRRAARQRVRPRGALRTRIVLVRARPRCGGGAARAAGRPRRALHALSAALAAGMRPSAACRATRLFRRGLSGARVFQAWGRAAPARPLRTNSAMVALLCRRSADRATASRPADPRSSSVRRRSLAEKIREARFVVGVMSSASASSSAAAARAGAAGKARVVVAAWTRRCSAASRRSSRGAARGLHRAIAEAKGQGLPVAAAARLAERASPARCDRRRGSCAASWRRRSRARRSRARAPAGRTAGGRGQAAAPCVAGAGTAEPRRGSARGDHGGSAGRPVLSTRVADSRARRAGVRAGW